MCTVLIAHRVVPGARVILAANRDELIDRASAAPAVLHSGADGVIAGGRDLVAGGTWLAVSSDGRVAAVTNRHVGLRDPARRSRGEIPLMLLEAGDRAHEVAVGLQAGVYNPVNVLLADAGGVVVVHVDEEASPIELSPGLHVLTTVDVDSEAKALRLRGLLEAALAGAPSSVLAAVESMEAVLRDHGPDGGAGLDAACVHGDRYGTVSSSSVAVLDDAGVIYRHAAGRPDETAHQDVSSLLRRQGR